MKIQFDNLVDLKNAENAYLLAKIGADTAENEQKFAKNCKKNVLMFFDTTEGGRFRRAPFRGEMRHFHQATARQHRII